MYPVIKQVIINQTLLSIPLAIIANYLRELSGQKYSPEIPTLYEFVKDFIACLLLREPSFYYIHRLLHHPRIYKHFHKRHHEWKKAIAITTIYGHPLDHFLINLVPIFSGMK